MKPPKLHERLRDVLGALVLADPEGAAIDYGRDVVSQGDGGHGKHGTTSVAPPAVSQLALEWAEFFSRALDMAELDLAQAKGIAPRPERVGTGRVKAGVANARQRRICTSAVYRGRPDAFVAYVEGCSTDLVRKARAARDLDGYGFPKPAALTSSRPTP